MLKVAENNYDTTQNECLVVIWVDLFPRAYVERSRFFVRVADLKELTSRLAC